MTKQQLLLCAAYGWTGGLSIASIYRYFSMSDIAMSNVLLNIMCLLLVWRWHEYLNLRHLTAKFACVANLSLRGYQRNHIESYIKENYTEIEDFDLEKETDKFFDQWHNLQEF